MGKISRTIEEKERELMWLKIKFIIKLALIILGPITVLILIHVMKKKTKKKIKSKIKERIKNRGHKDIPGEDDDFEIYAEDI